MKIIPLSHALRGSSLSRMVILLVVSLVCNSSLAAITGDYSGELINTYCDVKGNQCTFTLVTSSTNTKKPYVQLSLDKDFSRIKYVFALEKGSISKNYVCTINADQLEPATYYWRASDAKGDMLESRDGTQLTFGSKEVTNYELTVDPTIYDDVELSNEAELSLESVWLRTENNGNRIEWANAPYCSSNTLYTAPSDDYTDNHGMVVRGSVIYVARGTFNVSNWKYDKAQVWLDRYDLQTGESISLLRVRPDDNNDYVEEEVMSLIGEDSDGTVYFTSSIIEGSGNKVKLYTVDLNNIVTQDGYEVALSHLEQEFTIPATPMYMRFLTVRGSIKGGNYSLWGAEGKNELEKLAGFEVPVYRWTVSNGTVTVKSAKITQFATVDLNNVDQVRIISPKVLPVSDDLFYFHARPFETDVLFHPALYRMPSDSGETCEMLTSISDADISLHNTMAESPLGMSLFEIDDTPIFAYGRRTSSGSSVQLLELSPDDMSFATARKLWNINPSGFSTINVQGCNIAYIPDDDVSPSGNMIVYVPNGGLGLYRLTVNGTTVVLTTVSERLKISVYGRTVELPMVCRDLKIVDMSGRLCLQADRVSSIDVSSLNAGIYMLVSPTLSVPEKILLK